MEASGDLDSQAEYLREMVKGLEKLVVGTKGERLNQATLEQPRSTKKLSSPSEKLQILDSNDVFLLEK